MKKRGNKEYGSLENRLPYNVILFYYAFTEPAKMHFAWLQHEAILRVLFRKAKQHPLQ